MVLTLYSDMLGRCAWVLKREECSQITVSKLRSSSHSHLYVAGVSFILTEAVDLDRGLSKRAIEMVLVGEKKGDRLGIEDKLFDLDFTDMERKKGRRGVWVRTGCMADGCKLQRPPRAIYLFMLCSDVTYFGIEGWMTMFGKASRGDYGVGVIMHVHERNGQTWMRDKLCIQLRGVVPIVRGWSSLPFSDLRWAMSVDEPHEILRVQDPGKCSTPHKYRMPLS
jgi:hypothetical protein